MMENKNKKIAYTRPSWDEYFLNLVETIGKRATCNRGRSGCVIIKEKRILATGYVGAPTGAKHCDEIGHEMHAVIHEDGHQTTHCIRTSHAEQNAIANAARFGVALENATLYCHMTPCYICAKMIINAGIKKVVCNKDYQAGERSKELFKECRIEFILINPEIEKY